MATGLLLALCVGCGSSTNPATPAPVGSNETESPSTGASAILADDWTTFAHDYRRTGLETQQTGISRANVSTLTLRWSKKLADEIYSSPLVYGGLVIVGGQSSGTIYALSSATGEIVWQTHIGGQIRATGTIADNQLFVGNHNFVTEPSGDYDAAVSTFYDLDLMTGSVRWQIPINGTIRGTPAVGGGRVYYAVAGGDLPSCFQGGVFAVDESSGTPVWSWYVEPTPDLGGAVWAPLTFDGTRVFFGTGNTCGPAISTANGFVSLDAATGKLDWSLVAQPNSVSDDDTGGGALLLNNALYFISKNGYFYSVDQATGRQNAAVQLNPYDFQGGWDTATTDGSTIIIGNGALSPPTAASRRLSKPFYSVRRSLAGAPAGSQLLALDAGLNIKWRVPSQNPIVSYAAINNGLVFAPLDASIAAIDIATGTILWTYSTRNVIDAGPAVVPSGVYVADTEGSVYAFSLPAASRAVKRR